MVVMIISLFFYGAVDAWWESIFECGVFVLAAIAIFESFFKNRWDVRKIGPVWPLAAITAYAYLQILTLPAPLAKALGLVQQGTLSIDPYQTQLTARKLLALTLFFGLLLVHTSTVGRLRWLTRVVIGAGLGTALFGLIRQLLQSPESTEGFVLTFLFYGVGYGQFISANAFAYVTEMAFGVVAGLLLGGGLRRSLALLYVTVLALIWTALVLASSRGAILGFACESVFLLFIASRWFLARRDSVNNRLLTLVGDYRLVQVGILVIIMAILTVGVVWMGGQELAGKFTREASANAVFTDELTRRDIWRASWELFKHNKWSGTGFGCYFLDITRYQVSSGRIKLEQAHNDYLDLAANGGVIAVALGAWFIASVFPRARKALQSRDAYRRAVCLGALAGVLGVAVHSLVDFGLQVTGITAMCGALLVIAIVDVSHTSSRRRRLAP
jgi:O-antigen ligase